jgi:hypothetical protein
MPKSAHLLAEFVAYCMTHPEDSFWKALRDWSGYKYILASNGCSVYESGEDKQIDTKDWETKNGEKPQ